LGAFNNVYDSGDNWLVKNNDVWIQGRYGTTIWSRGGSSLLSLAIGGPFLQQGGRNHTLIIEPTDGGGMVTWDGEQIVKKAPSEFVIPGFLRVTYASDDTRIDEGLKSVPVDTVRVYMPRRVNLRVNRWPKHIDALIESPQQLHGQEGHCGNFNLDDSDDSVEQIAQRTGSISSSASLFPEQMQGMLEAMPFKWTLDDCEEHFRANALKACRKNLRTHHSSKFERVHNNLLDACVFDICFGGKDFASESHMIDVEFGQLES